MKLLAPALVLLAAAATPPGTLDDDDVVEVDLVALTSIEWEEGDELPKWVQDLDGKQVAFSGFMFSSEVEDASQFLVVGNSCQCGGTPLVHHFVEVTLEEGTTDYRPGQLDFLGRLSVGEVEEDDFVVSLFRLAGGFF